MEILQTFPPEYANRVKSTYEQVLEEGIEEGIEKGMKKGREEGREEGKEAIVRNFITNRPDYSDQSVAELLIVPISMVARVRANL